MFSGSQHTLHHVVKQRRKALADLEARESVATCLNLKQIKPKAFKRGMVVLDLVSVELLSHIGNKLPCDRYRIMKIEDFRGYRDVTMRRMNRKSVNRFPLYGRVTWGFKSNQLYWVEDRKT